MRRFVWIALALALPMLAGCIEQRRVVAAGGGGSGGAGAGGSGSTGGSGGAGGTGGEAGGGGTIMQRDWDGSGAWKPADGPLGIWNGGGLFATESGALLRLDARARVRSLAGGRSWSEVARTWDFDEKFAEAGGALLVSDGVRLYRSTDDGASWTDVGHAPGHLFGSGPGDLVYATWELDAVGQHLHRSADGGATWELRAELPVDHPRGVLYARGDVLLLPYAEGPNPGLHRSTDGGLTWQFVEGAADVAGAAGFGTRGALTFAIASNGQVHRSSDSGLTWSVVPVAEGNGRIGLRGFVEVAGELFVATGEDLLRWSDDDGEWQIAAIDPPVWLEALAGTHDALYAASREALYRWDDKKLRFEPVESAHVGTRIEAIAAGEGVRFARTVEGTVFRNEGAGWIERPDLLRMQWITWLGGSRWIGSGSDGPLLSEDGGATFHATGKVLPYDPTVRHYVAVGPKVFALAISLDGTAAVVRSNDGGWTWEDLRDRLPLVDAERRAQPWWLAAVGERLFATVNGGLLYSDDAGESWTAADTSPWLVDVTTAGDAVYARRSDDAGVTHVWRSHDGGHSWEPFANGWGSCFHTWQILGVRDALVLVEAAECRDSEGTPVEERASTRARKLWVRTAGSDAWQAIGGPLPASIRQVAQEGDTLWVATDGAGVWRLDLP